MRNMGIRDTKRPDSDQLLQDIADYVMNFKADSEEARHTAAYCLMDTLGCGILALKYPACTKMLGPIVEGAQMDNGAKVPGTSYQLEPVMAAFNIGTMVSLAGF